MRSACIPELACCLLVQAACTRRFARYFCSSSVNLYIRVWRYFIQAACTRRFAPAKSSRCRPCLEEEEEEEEEQQEQEQEEEEEEV